MIPSKKNKINNNNNDNFEETELGFTHLVVVEGRGREECVCVFYAPQKSFIAYWAFVLDVSTRIWKISTELINYGTHFFFNSSFLMKYYITVYLIINIFQHFPLAQLHEKGF